MNQKVGNVIEDITTYPDTFFNTIFSDPPYQLGTKYYIGENGQYAIKGASNDFMSKWSGVTPEQWNIFFREAMRTLKHGGYCCMFGMEESSAILQYYAIKYGFEICQSLAWYNIQGFPKSLNVSKMIDKTLGLEREQIINPLASKQTSQVAGKGLSGSKSAVEYITPNSVCELSSQYDGYHAGIKPLKPCLETIYVFRKPIKGKSIVDDIMSNDETISPACVNIDGCRVNYTSDYDKKYQEDIAEGQENATNGKFFGGSGKSLSSGISNGRYPSQLFVDSECAELLDKQSGKVTGGSISAEATQGFGGSDLVFGEGGSKILHHCDYENEDKELVYFNSKVANTERNIGLDTFEDKFSARLPMRSEGGDREGIAIDGTKMDRTSVSKNSHPTLKPISLIHNIFKLFKLPIEDQKVYVPFSGAGSEIIGILSTGIKEENLYACELSQEYVDISEARQVWYKSANYSLKQKIKKTETTKEEFDIFGAI